MPEHIGFSAVWVGDTSENSGDTTLNVLRESFCPTHHTGMILSSIRVNLLCTVFQANQDGIAVTPKPAAPTLQMR